MKKTTTTKMLPQRQHFNALHGFCIVLMLLAFGQSKAQYTAIPDANFEDALSTYDDFPDDYQVPTANISGVTILNVAGMGISDLTGIEDFTSLVELECASNNLTSIDVSSLTALEFLNLIYNNIDELDVSNNTALTYLNCTDNNLDELDVSNNTALLHLECARNNLEAIDVSNSPLLISLNCGDNDIDELDVTINTALKYLTFGLSNVDEIDLSNNTALEYLNFNLNNVEEIDLTNNTALQYLFCAHNDLDELDITGLTDLRRIDCLGNNIEVLDLTGMIDLQYLDCSYNPIEELNLSDTVWLKFLNANECALTAIDLSDVNLEYLYLQDNEISAIDVSGQSDLLELGIAATLITTLDLAGCPDLTGLNYDLTLIPNVDFSDVVHLQFLSCDHSGPCTTFDVSMLPDLNYLSCAGRSLTSLDVSGNTILTWIRFSDNPITSIDLTANTLLTDIDCTETLLSTINLLGLTLDFLFAQDNPNLTCIAIDNPTAAASNPNFHKDAGATYWDEVCKVTKVQASQCGVTLASITTYVYADAVAGATDYQFSITDGTTTWTPTSTSRRFHFSLIAGTFHNTTYAVKARAFVGGIWQVYGVSCNVTTPTTPPLTTLDTACGSTITLLTTKIYADFVPGVHAYKFKVEYGGYTEEIETTPADRFFKISQLPFPTMLGYNRIYTVSVATKVYSTWGSYGTPCYVTSDSVSPLSKVRDYCGLTLPALNTNIYAISQIAVEGYRFKVTYSGSTQYFDTTNQFFSLSSWSGGNGYGRTYTVCVATKVNGSYGSYGDCCEVSTPASPRRAAAITDEESMGPELKGFPNPFTNTFTLRYDINKDVILDVKVFDLNGRLLDSIHLKAGELDNLMLGGKYMSGLYNVIVTEGEEAKSLLMVKK